MMEKFSSLAPTLCTLSICLPLTIAHAQEASSPDSVAALQEIVVTAQKRSESINTVPMSISAVSGDDLRAQGIQSVGDLEKVVLGFTYTPSPYAVPIYTIRGIGFNETTCVERSI